MSDKSKTTIEDLALRFPIVKDTLVWDCSTFWRILERPDEREIILQFLDAVELLAFSSVNRKTRYWCGLLKLDGKRFPTSCWKNPRVKDFLANDLIHAVYRRQCEWLVDACSDCPFLGKRNDPDSCCLATQILDCVDSAKDWDWAVYCTSVLMEPPASLKCLRRIFKMSGLRMDSSYQHVSTFACS